MTPAFAAMREIAAGRAPADYGLLQNCRLEGFGIQAFGREPILDLFRRAPMDLSQAWTVLESPRALLVVDDDRAIFADLHDARVSRLWVLGTEGLATPEPAVCVARDLDLSQTEAALMFDAFDHPDLDAAGGARLARLAQPSGLTGFGLPEFSRRTFVVRAFSTADRVAALVICAGALDAVERKPFTVNLALLATTDTGRESMRVVVDRAGLLGCRQRPWTPRVGRSPSMRAG